MYNHFQLARKYLHYYLTASNGKGHGIHSPFVFDFITTVLNDRRPYPAYNIVERLRQQLLHDQRVVSVQDFGAGSTASSSSQRSIASIAKNAAKPKKFGQLLYRMVRQYQPATVLELGTSLGITTSYLAMASPVTRVLTMEGSSAIAAVARQNFSDLHLQQVELIEGNFDKTLPEVLHRRPSPDFVFIDGNHRREPTERYFEALFPGIQNDTILIFDDIHWSPEMEAAWANIKDRAEVRCTIDLFFIGIILFRAEFREKQHFVIRF